MLVFKRVVSSYFKKLLAPKARVLIDDLPFTTDGNERLKVILKSNFGKPKQVKVMEKDEILEKKRFG